MGESFIMATPVGKLQITTDLEHVCQINLNNQLNLSKPQNILAKEVARQINAYFKSASFCFDLPLKQAGTKHQLKVWKALSTIPSGKVLTYGELAKKLFSSARAIGNACRNNPLPIVVPCHRIVAATGIGGFSGAKKGVLLTIKSDLLRHEGLCY